MIELVQSGLWTRQFLALIDQFDSKISEMKVTLFYMQPEEYLYYILYQIPSDKDGAMWIGQVCQPAWKPSLNSRLGKELWDLSLWILAKSKLESESKKTESLEKNFSFPPYWLTLERTNGIKELESVMSRVVT